jgi:hypothetical protein
MCMNHNIHLKYFNFFNFLNNKLKKVLKAKYPTQLAFKNGKKMFINYTNYLATYFGSTFNKGG